MAQVGSQGVVRVVSVLSGQVLPHHGFVRGGAEMMCAWGVGQPPAQVCTVGTSVETFVVGSWLWFGGCCVGHMCKVHSCVVGEGQCFLMTWHSCCLIGALIRNRSTMVRAWGSDQLPAHAHGVQVRALWCSGPVTSTDAGKAQSEILGFLAREYEDNTKIGSFQVRV